MWPASPPEDRAYTFVPQSEMEVGSHHILRTHGIKLARKHLLDWLILLTLGVILFIVNRIHPFHRFVSKEMMPDFKYPMQSDTVPFWTVVVCSLPLPAVVFLVQYFRHRDAHDLHHSVLGLLFSCIMTAVIVDALKVAVGRPRPDFFWRCFPDGKDAYDQWGDAACHGDPHIIREGRKSFPSGHTSWGFAGLVYLSLYLSAKVKLYDRRGSISKLCIPFSLLLTASLVGFSRISNYKHHWQDVLTGASIGFVVATACYLQFFPPPHHPHGCRSFSSLQFSKELEKDIRDTELGSRARGDGINI